MDQAPYKQGRRSTMYANMSKTHTVSYVITEEVSCFTDVELSR